MYLRKLCTTIFKFKSVLSPKDIPNVSKNSMRYRPTFNSNREDLRINQPPADPYFSRRQFHTSSATMALPTVVYWIVLRGVFKFAAMVAGRAVRMWWLRLPDSGRQYYAKEFQRRQPQMILVTALSVGALSAYYTVHLVEDPITKRKRFLIFSQTQMTQIANIQSEALVKKYRNHIVTSGKDYKKISYVVRRVLATNGALPGIKRRWRVHVIAKEEPKNAFVLPSGDIFIFAGILRLANNEDQLAVIIGHEMAHALLNHSAEIASKTHLIEFSTLLPIFIIWALLPDIVALCTHVFLEYMVAVLFYLPLNRSIETEADMVGVEIVARACFDPREASKFWRNMEALENKTPTEWLSTHPNNKTRQQNLDGHVPKAIRIFGRHCTGSDLDPRSPRN